MSHSHKKIVFPLVALCLPLVCDAQPYSFHKELDLPFIGVLAAMQYTSGATLAETRQTPLNLDGLHRQDIPAFDRWAIGFYSPKLSSMSSVIGTAELAIPVAVNAWDTYTGSQAWYGVLVDALLFEEATTLSSSLSSYSKSFIRLHSTPLAYDPNVSATVREQPQNVSSFFSGHTTFAFTTAVFSAYTFQLRHSESPLVPWVWGGSLAMATGVGSMRILAGKHFPSDVVMGAAVGAACGFVVPWLHTRPWKSGRKSVSERNGENRKDFKLDWDLGFAMLEGTQMPVPTVSVNF